jgi:hypothetical protein
LEKALAMGILVVDEVGQGWYDVPKGDVMEEEAKSCQHSIALRSE